MVYNKKEIQKKGEAMMKPYRLNERFMSEYIELDSDCCEKFGIPSGGVTEYINRLNNSRFAPGRDEVLPRLVRYRNVRNKFAHETGAIRRSEELDSSDIAWIRRFTRDIRRSRDPLSVYLRRARRFARRRRIRRYITVTAAVLLILLAALIVFAVVRGG